MIVTITIPNFKKWQKPSERREWVALDCHFLDDPKVYMAQSKDPSSIAVYLWALTTADSQGVIEVTFEYLKAALKKATAKTGNNFKPERYLEILSNCGLITFKTSSNEVQTTFKPPSNHVQTPFKDPFEQPQTRVAVISNIQDKQNKQDMTESCSPAKAHLKKGTRLSDDWSPSSEMIDWAKKERPDLNVERESACFRDYWKAQPGSRGVKLDWEATWRNWIRRAKASRPVVIQPGYLDRIESHSVFQEGVDTL